MVSGVDRIRWVELDEFPDYAVSEMGDVHNIRTGLPRKTSENQQGVVKISMYVGNRLYTRSVAVLVAENFCDGRSDIFDTPIHLNGDRTDCRASNLQWRPRWFAIKYHRQFDVPAFHEQTPEIEEINTGNRYSRVKHACIDLGLYYNDVYRSYVHDAPIPFTDARFRLVKL